MLSAADQSSMMMTISSAPICPPFAPLGPQCSSGHSPPVRAVADLAQASLQTVHEQRLDGSFGRLRMDIF